MKKPNYAAGGMASYRRATAAAFAAALTCIPPLSFAVNYTVLPTVTVTGSHVTYPNPSWYSPGYAPTQNFFTGGMQIGSAIQMAQTKAISLSNVCTPPSSPAARSTTSRSGTEERWLAAQEMFNRVHMAGLWNMYRNATGSLSFILNGKTYPGFRVTYADGFVETWAVTPNYAFSSVKLFDQPLPNSLKASGSPGCMKG